MFNELLEVLEKKNWDYTIIIENSVRTIEFYMGNELISCTDISVTEDLINSILEW